MTDNSSDTPNGIETGAGEPSMEDILASIRRIIAEDDEGDQNHLDTGRSFFADTQNEEAPQADNDLVEDIALAVEEAPQSVDEEVMSTADDDILVLDQLLSDTTSAKELTEIETEELILDTSDDDFNPVSSVVSDLEDRLSADRDPNELSLPATTNEEIGNLVFSNDDVAEEISTTLSEESELLDLGSDDDLAIDDLMEDLVLDTPETNTAEPVVAELLEEPADEVVVQSIVSDEMESTDLESESDLDIVKSLMADLADTSFLDDEDLAIPVPSSGVVEVVESEADLTPTPDSVLDEVIGDVLVDASPPMDTTDDILADLGLDLVEPEAESDPIVDEVMDLVTEDLIQESAASESDQDEILNEILELTIEDEEASVADALDLAVEDLVMDEPTVSDDNPLLQIAAKAEADADAIDGSELAGAAAIAATGAVGAVVASQNEEAEELSLPSDDVQSTEDILSELDLALAEVAQEDSQEEAPALQANLEPEPEPEIVAETESKAADTIVEPEESEAMPRTARKDAIINEVTEEATTDAFAELSQAVEEKAVFTESGPRIGDIVQDALRPMLKDWLDENLKSIVERAVAKEVKRISSGK